MEILVLIKQVPGSSRVEVDPDTGVLRRDGVEGKMNPYDLYALEAALRLRDAGGGRVTVLSMGPPQAEEVIREAYALGADHGCLLTDRRFAGADVLATSRALSQCIRKLGPIDLIICGKQTTDGDTAQVGPAIAEWLGLPHVAWVSRIIACDSRSLCVEQDLPETVECMSLDFPCLLTVDKGDWVPRLPSFRKRLERADWPVERIGFDDLPDRDESLYGLKGSPTQVGRIFPPPVNDARVLHEGTGAELATFLNDWLVAERFV